MSRWSAFAAATAVSLPALLNACAPAVLQTDATNNDATSALDAQLRDGSSDVPGRRYPTDTIVIPPPCAMGGLNGQITRIHVGANGCPNSVEAIGYPRPCDCTPLSPCCDIDSTCVFPVEFGYNSYNQVCSGGIGGLPEVVVREMGQCINGRLNRAGQRPSPFVEVCTDCVSCFPQRDL